MEEEEIKERKHNLLYRLCVIAVKILSLYILKRWNATNTM